MCSLQVERSMFPNSSNLGCLPFPPKHHQQSNFFNKLPLNIPLTLLSHQQIIDAQFNFQNAALSWALSGNLATIPAVTLQPLTYGNGSPVCMSAAPMSFRGRKRLSEQSVPYDVKRQRFHSSHRETTVVNQAVPLPEERRYSFPGSFPSPLFHAHYIPDLTGCVLPLRDTSLPDPIETTLPVAKDKVISFFACALNLPSDQQVLELFQVCQQQTCDLNRKELCRTELQREIQCIFRSRLFLVASSLNGFSTCSSDGDLCLVVKEPVNQKTEARHILSLVQKLFSTKLSSYIERPQLIKAKVPIVKFRDKVSLSQEIIPMLALLPDKPLINFENRVHLLVLAVKKWASYHDMNDDSRGILSSYSLVLMVLHYLQKPFDWTNSARAVHEKQFDIIKDEFLKETEEQGIKLNAPIPEKIDSKYFGISYPICTETQETQKTSTVNKAVDLDHPDFSIEKNKQAESAQMEMEHPDFSYSREETEESESTQLETEYPELLFSMKETEALESAQLETEQPDFSYSMEETEELESAQLEMEHPDFFSREEMEELESAQPETEHPDFSYSREEMMESECAQLEMTHADFSFSREETEESERAQLEMEHQEFLFSREETEKQKSVPFELEQPESFP
ncbi:LOW QUALITY PROTEIN: poly(A) RNA polymerase GLD2-like [Spheniscus humboldti]